MKATAVRKPASEPPKKPVAREEKSTPAARPVPPGEDEEEEGGHRKRRCLAENSNLPLVSVIDDQPTMDLAKELLEEAQLLNAEQDRTTQRLKEIKEQLVGIARNWELPGMRFGKIGLQYSGERIKMTLSKELLIENGTDPEVIKMSYKESKPYVDARFIPYD